MKYIKLTQFKKTKVSNTDYDYLNQFKWAYDRHNHCAVRGIWNAETKTTRVISMHRFLMNTPSGMDTDHINGDRLDNTRENLRICSHKQNQSNMKKHKDNSTGLLGVSRARNGKYVAKIKNKHIGTFESALEAAKAYDKASQLINGNFANTNGLGV